MPFQNGMFELYNETKRWHQQNVFSSCPELSIQAGLVEDLSEKNRLEIKSLFDLFACL